MIDIRYASIRSMDISNGEGIGVALFVQGCHFQCKNCFNHETWDFNGGKEWTSETKEKFLELIDRPYIKRISLLGGECLAEENLDDVLDLVNEIRLSFPQKSIWLYTGYQFEHIFKCYRNGEYVGFPHHDKSYPDKNTIKRQDIIRQCDVLVDGRYIESKRDLARKWCGSSNQNVIDIQKTLEKRKVILWDA